MMRTTQIKNGNYHHKTSPFSINKQRTRKKTKQIQNLARLYEIGTIGLGQYLISLSLFIGTSLSGVKNKKTPTDLNTSSFNNEIDNEDTD